MNWRNRTHEIDPEDEEAMRRLFAPLKAATSRPRVADSLLQEALLKAPPQPATAPQAMRRWQRALVGVGAVFIPLFAVGGVAGLGGSPISGSLDAVAGVFKSNGDGPASAGSQPVDPSETPTSDDETPVFAASSGAEVCTEATTNAKEVLQALLDGDTLTESGAAGVEAAMKAIDSCGEGEGEAATCFEATATAREILQALLDTETMPEAGRAGIENALAAVEACGSEGEEDPEETGDTSEDTSDAATAPEDREGGPGTGHETCYEANAHAREVLQALIDDEDRPEQSKRGLERALEALENCGTGNGKQSGDSAPAEGTPAPETTPSAASTPAHGKPDTTGKPNDVGKPENPAQQDTNGKPDTTGKPDTAGKPAGTGKPDTAGSTAAGDQPTGDASHGPPDHAGGPSGGNAGQGQGAGPDNGHGHGGGAGGGPSDRPGRP